MSPPKLALVPPPHKHTIGSRDADPLTITTYTDGAVVLQHGDGMPMALPERLALALERVLRAARRANGRGTR